MYNFGTEMKVINFLKKCVFQEESKEEALDLLIEIVANQGEKSIGQFKVTKSQFASIYSLMLEKRKIYAIKELRAIDNSEHSLKEYKEAVESLVLNSQS